MSIAKRIRARFARPVDIAEHTQCTCLARVGELHIQECPLVSHANLLSCLDALPPLFLPRTFPVIDFTRSIPGRAKLIEPLELDDLL